VLKMAEELGKTVFRKLRVSILHGQMKPKEKETVMEAYAAGKIDILITTVIVEVGIDVPNANVMAIEHSERFGLATLHQLRGRVGRGADESYCILLGRAGTMEAKQRRDILLSTNDGFKIAEEDLRLRGSGELFGTEQHGLPEFRIGNLVTDYDIINQARQAAFNVIDADPVLIKYENRGIRKIFLEKYRDKFILGSIG